VVLHQRREQKPSGKRPPAAETARARRTIQQIQGGIKHKTLTLPLIVNGFLSLKYDIVIEMLFPSKGLRNSALPQHENEMQYKSSVRFNVAVSLVVTLRDLLSTGTDVLRLNRNHTITCSDTHSGSIIQVCRNVKEVSRWALNHF
jgi:hypothetical protein